MENKTSSARQGNQTQRHLANLKLVSRLLGHELHAQGASKTITMSRDQVEEIRTSLDLFIEEVTRRAGAGGMGAAAAADAPRLVSARN